MICWDMKVDNKLGFFWGEGEIKQISNKGISLLRDGREVVQTGVVRRDKS